MGTNSNPRLVDNGVLDLIELAWGVIANAGGGNWDKETVQWREAAAEWRDKYHIWMTQSNRP